MRYDGSVFVLKDQSSLFLLRRIVRKVLISKASMNRFHRASMIGDRDAVMMQTSCCCLQLRSGSSTMSQLACQITNHS